MPLSPTTQIEVTLSAEQWNGVLGLLNETGPYRVVAPLVQAITTQCMEHDKGDDVPGVFPPAPIPKPNGAHAAP
jgi:hypothetical protein